MKCTENKKNRSIPLASLAVDALKTLYQEQQESKRQSGADYRDLGLVFASPEGDFLKPDSVTEKACLLAKKTGLKGIGFHSLRHSHGSQLLSNGVPLPTVSKRLGHANVSITGSIYSHAFTKDELAAADIWDVAMRTQATAARAKQ